MIYITGDTHGEFRRIIDFCDRVETTRDDVMIILGDAGINFSGYPRDGWKKQLLARVPLKIFCIHGNHEKRPETIKSYKTTTFHGGTVWYEYDYPNILFAKDGEILKGQISERIKYDAVAFKLFDENKQGFVYATNTYEYPGEDCIIGYFASAELAYEAGRREGFRFKIEKFQIISEELDVPGSPVAALEYDADGKLIDYWSYEVSKEDKLLVDSLGRHRFENAYVVLPNPFELGEYVRFIGTTEIGRVDVSQEDWARYVKKAQEPNAIDDYSDASITIRYNYDKWAHNHLSPLYLERVNIDTDYTIPMVLSGHAD